MFKAYVQAGDDNEGEAVDITQQSAARQKLGFTLEPTSLTCTLLWARALHDRTDILVVPAGAVFLCSVSARELWLTGYGLVGLSGPARALRGSQGAIQPGYVDDLRAFFCTSWATRYLLQEHVKQRASGRVDEGVAVGHDWPWQGWSARAVISYEGA